MSLVDRSETRREFSVEVLEQRILFSGDPVEVTLGGAVGDEVVMEEVQGESAAADERGEDGLFVSGDETVEVVVDEGAGDVEAGEAVVTVDVARAVVAAVATVGRGDSMGREGNVDPAAAELVEGLNAANAPPVTRAGTSASPPAEAADAAIDLVAQTALVEGFVDLANWLGELSSHDLFARELPVVGLTLGEAFDLGAFFLERVATPVSDYFAGDLTPTTDELIVALNGLAGTVGDTVIAWADGVTGGLNTGALGEQLVFDFDFAAERSFVTALDFGASLGILDLVADAGATIALTARLVIDATVGVELEGGLGPAEAFFLQIDELAVQLTAAVTNAAVDFDLGFLGVRSTGASLRYDAVVSLAVADPEPDGEDKISVADLQGTDLASLLTLSTTGSVVDIDLPLRVSGISGLNLNAVKVVIDGDPFSPGGLTWDFSGTANLVEQARAFLHTGPSGILDTLRAVSGWLTGFSNTTPFIVDVPGVGDLPLSLPLDLGGLFQTNVIDELFEVNDGLISYDFSNLQELGIELTALLGVNVTPIFDAVTKEFRFTLNYTLPTVQEVVDLNLEGDFGVLGRVETSGEVAVDVAGTFSMVLYVGLAPFSATLVAPGLLPAGHTLSGPAVFDLQINDALAPVTVTVAAGARPDRSTLLADLQAAIDAAVGAGEVLVGEDGGRLTLTTGELTGAFIVVTTAEGDPAMTELGFDAFNIATDTITSRLKVANVVATGSASFAATDVGATADFGLVRISATGGTVHGAVAASVTFRDPLLAANAPVTFQRLNGAIGAIDDFVTFSHSGSFGFTLPNLVVTTPLPIAVGAGAEISVNVPNIFSAAAPQVTSSGLDELLKFERVDFDSLLDGLRGVRDFLDGFSNQSVLRELVPGVSKSLADVVDFADPFIDALAILEDPGLVAPVLDEIEATLEGAFGIAPEDLLMGWDGTDLTLDFDLEHLFAANETFYVDLADLGISTFGSLFDVSAGGTVAVSGSATLLLGLGIDLSVPTSPRFFIRDTSTIGVTLDVDGTGLSFTTSIGPLEVGIVGGAVTVEDSAGGAASITVGLNPTGSGRYYVTSLNVGVLSLSADARAAVNLPLELNGSPVGEVDFTIGDLSDPGGTLDTSGTTVDFAALVSGLDLFNDPDALENGLDFVFRALDDLLGTSLAEFELPFFGGSLAEVITFIPDLANALSSGFSGAASATLARDAVFAALDALGWTTDLNGVDGITVDDIPFLNPATKAVVDDPSTLPDGFLLDLVLHSDPVAFAPAIDFDIGIPGLGLSVAPGSTFMVSVSFDLHLQVGVTKADGVFLSTDVGGPEMQLSIGATIPNFNALGELAFLEVEVWDWVTAPEDKRGPDHGYSASSLGAATLTVDIVDPVGGGNKLTFSELSSGAASLANAFDVEFSAGAEINLLVEVRVDSGDIDLPSLLTTIDLDWTLGGAGLAPTLAFRDVRVDAGEFFSGVLGPLLEPINTLLEPLAPIIDFLNTKLPIGGATVLELLGRLGGTDLSTVQKFVDALDQIGDLAAKVSNLGSGTYFNMGDVVLGGAGLDLRSVPASGIDLGGAGVDLSGATDTASLVSQFGSLGSVKADTEAVGGFSFPILDNPLSAFGLLLGQDVVLFEYDLPRLEFGTEFNLLLAVIPVFGVPVSLKLFGGLGLTVDLAFGYDTYGIRKFAESDFTDPFALVDGFYVADWVDGVDRPEVTLYAELGVSASIDLAVIEVGVSGSLKGEIFLNLHEDADPDEGGVLDGRIRWFEFNLSCLFDIGGRLSFLVKAFAKIGPCPFCVKPSVTLADITLVSFDYEVDCDPTPPELARYDSSTGEVALNIGPDAGLRGAFNTEDGDEEFVVTRGTTDESVFVSAFGFRQEYGPENPGDAPVSMITGNGGEGNDVIQGSRSLEVPMNVGGGNGNDELIGGMGNDQLSGGDGDDRITGNAGLDHLNGDAGMDTLLGGEGNDVISGGSDDDFLFGDDGDDTLNGGSGKDTIDGGDGGDTIDGGADTDSITGGPGGDTIRGGSHDDQIEGGDGDDTIWGDSGNDGIRGGNGVDTVYGGFGFDVILGGGGADFLYGGDGGSDAEDAANPGSGYSDIIYGDYASGTGYADGSAAAAGAEPEGGDMIRGQGGRDYLSGEGGADQIYGGNDDDRIYGGDGVDVLEGGNGSDRIYGGGDGDTIRGQGDGDFLYGEGGADTIEGGPGADLIRGGGSGDVIDGGTGSDEIYGDSGGDLINGSAGVDRIYGVSGADVIHGGDDGDFIYGGSGADELFGDDGDDRVFGATGNDEIHGGNDDDWLYGEADDDEIYGDAGNDRQWGGSGDDVIYGNGGDDQQWGEAGDDEIHGDDGDDVARGGDGDDLIFGDADDDELYGDAGEDVIWGSTGADEIHGGDGKDTLYGEEDGDTIWGGNDEDRIFGAGGDDQLSGEAGDDLIRGDAGVDTIEGGEGNDTVFGGDGDDAIRGGAGDDLLWGERGADVVYGDDVAGVETGRDSIWLGDGDDVAFGGAGEDEIFGEAGNDTLNGGEGEDFIDGGAGGDTIHGDGGDDRLVAGQGLAGTEVIYGDDGDDVIYGSDRGGDDAGVAGVGYAGASGDRLYGGAGNDVIFGLGGADLIDGGDGDDEIDGGAHGDRIVGGAGRDVLRGGYGDDVLLGGGGRDSLYGELGNDRLDGGADSDVLDGGFGADVLLGGDGDDELRAGNGTGDQLFGEGGNDVLYGSDDGDDLLDGGPGRDRLFGFAGNDTLLGGAGDDLLDGGDGNDVIEGGAGADVAEGGADGDVLYGHTASGVGDDGAVDILYGDFGTGGNEAGSGNDDLYGGGGNDLLFGEGGDDRIAAGGGASVTVVYGAGEGEVEADFPGLGTAQAPVAVAEVEPGRGDEDLPDAVTPGGLWGEISGSAWGGGFGAGQFLALDLDVAASPVTAGLVAMAWSDARRGNFEIYVAVSSAGGAWTSLGGSAGRGGVSGSQSTSRRPSVAFGGGDEVWVAWTEGTGAGGGSNAVRVARWDSGTTSWVELAGLSVAATADEVELVFVGGVPVVFFQQAGEVVAREWDGGAWADFGGAGTVTGGGAGVRNFSVAAGGGSVAVAWEAVNGLSTDVYVREWGGAAWVERAGSASGGGVSGHGFDSLAPAVSYGGGGLWVAWGQQTENGTQVWGERYSGGAWAAAGGVDELTAAPGALEWTLERAPQLGSGGGVMRLSYLDEAPAGRDVQRTRVFVRELIGGVFEERLPGDAGGSGVAPSASVSGHALAVGVDAVPVVAWQEAGADGYGAFALAQRADVSGTVVTALPGGPTVSDLLDGTLGTGDVIVLGAGEHAGFTVGAADSGVLILGATGHGATVTGDVVVSGAVGVVLERIDFGGAVTVTGGSGTTLFWNVFGNAGLDVAGAADAVTVLANVFGGGSPAVEIGAGVTGVEVRANRFEGSFGSGIAVTGPASGLVRDNELQGTGGGTGIEVGAAFDGEISGNRIGAFGLGVDYRAAAGLNGNVLEGNLTGVRTELVGAGYLGSVGAREPNVIVGGTTGIQLVGGARAENQVVRGAVTGIGGNGMAGGDALADGNVVEGSGTGIAVTGEVRFNRLNGNGVGIAAGGTSTLVRHNVVTESSDAGVRVLGGSTRVRVFNNSIWSLSGRGVEVAGGSTEAEILSNVVWVEGAGGYALWIDTLAHAGTHSDYNTLHVSDGATLAHYILDFDDILDWQRDIERFDLHSLGTTVVNPEWSEPAFENRWTGELGVFARLGEWRFTSPTVDSGSPLTDPGVTMGSVNLLVNGGFEGDLTGWNASPTASVGAPGVAAYEGATHLVAGTSDPSFAEQTIDLLAAGFPAAAIDGLDLYAVFGGRFRTTAVTLPQLQDRGLLEVAFLDASGVEIETVSVETLNATDRWELFGGRHLIPSGAREVVFRFESDLRSGNTNLGVFDAAFFYVEGETSGIDQGAVGNTASDADVVEARLALRTPDLYVDWERGLPHDIRWDSFGNVAELPVVIELWRDTAEGPAFFETISAATSDGGLFTWIPQNTAGVDFGSVGWRIQIELLGRAEVMDRSAETFAVPEDTLTFYVNDAVADAADMHTTVPGDNRNTGKTPNGPKPYANTILRLYSLGALETLYVDAGSYVTFDPIVLSGTIDVADDEGFVFTGPTNGSTATIAHAHPLTDEPVISLSDADFVTLANLVLPDGERGVHLFNNSTDFTGRNLVLNGHRLDGFYADGTSTVLSLDGVVANGNGESGIDLRVPVASLSGSVASGNAWEGFYLLSQSGGVLDGNTASGNGRSGIYVRGTDVTVSGARVSGNSQHGIDISGGGNVVSGGVVWNQVVVNRSGILAAGGARVEGSVVYGNWRGISLSNADAYNNRVYDNAKEGIYVSSSFSDEQVVGNVVYSNGTGIYVGGFRSGELVANNVVYANSVTGIWTNRTTNLASDPLLLANNTVYEPTADGVVVADTAQQVVLVDNIIVVGDGTGLTVAATAQVGFESDFNLFQVTGSGAVGFWQGAVRATLVEWRGASFGDFNSVAQDPLFVDVDGVDGLLGFAGPGANDGRDDDFHLMSEYGSSHGGALAPVLDGGTGLPVDLVPVVVNDAVTSPGIDRGDSASAFGDEPVPNGGYVNQGAYGNTGQASLSPVTYVRVLRPDGGEFVPQLQTMVVRWRSHDTGSTVDIELVERGSGSVVATLASGEANDGSYEWMVPDDGSVPPGSDYVVRVTRTDVALSDESDRGFTISPPISEYFVNDGTVEPGSRTTAPGSDANDGLTPATPKASIQSLLADYDLGVGDTVIVDFGTYAVTTNIIIGAGDAGVTVRGWRDGAFPGSWAVLDRGNTSSGQWVFELVDADDVVLDSLWITGGEHGIYAHTDSDSDGVVISNNTIQGNDDYGVWLRGGNDDVVLTGNLIDGYEPTGGGVRQFTGARIEGDRFTVTSNRIVGHTTYGFDGDGLAGGVVDDNEVWANSSGIRLGRAGQSATGNRVFGNYVWGIQAASGTVLEGNEVHGNYRGINASGNLVRGNVVFDNELVGINSSSGQIIDNTVYGTVGTGIDVTGSSVVRGNVVYGNGTGIHAAGFHDDVRIWNNVVYDNVVYGIHIERYGNGGEPPMPVEHNTVLEDGAVAIRLSGSARDIHLRNNIVRSGAAGVAAISVAADSQLDFSSDYNLVELGAGAVFGNWRGVDLATLADWFYELGFDGHTLTGAPGFVDTHGADGLLGFGAEATGAAIVMDDSDAGFSATGGWSVEPGGVNGGGLRLATVDGSETATWSFAGLTAGQTYVVYGTWQTVFNQATAALYEMWEEAELLGSGFASHRSAPDALEEAGASWERIGLVTVTGTTLDVVLRTVNRGGGYRADAVLLLPIGGDHGGDDGFGVVAGSPTIDAGDPRSFYLSEPAPNGGRANLGSTGNTAAARLSPERVVQVLTPNGNEKFESGNVVDLEYRAFGYAAEERVVLMNLGVNRWEAPQGFWLAERFGTGGISRSSTNNGIDLSGVAMPAPEAVYKSYANVTSSTGAGWALAVPDGAYTLRVHAIDTSSGTSNRFNLLVNGMVVLSDTSTAGEAGGSYRAHVFEFAVNASLGNGVVVEFEGVSGTSRISGLELVRANASPAVPVIGLEYSADSGGNWSAIPGGVGLGVDADGQGRFAWTAPVATAGNTGLVRAVAGVVSDRSDAPFLIAPGGNAFYINDGVVAAGDVTTAAGDNAASGKSADAPMASLAALIRAYDLEPGDVVYVDVGSYSPIANIVVTPEDAGVAVVGPAAGLGEAVFDRGSTATGSYVFELVDADGFRVERLTLTGAEVAIYAASGSDSDGVVVRDSLIFGNDDYGIYLLASNDGAELEGNRIHGATEGGTYLDQSYGARIDGDGTVATGNEVFETRSYGLYFLGDGVVISGNELWGIDGTGIYLSGSGGTVSGNRAWGNSVGIQVQGAGHVVSGNTANWNTATGISIGGASEVTGNVAYGQRGSGSSTGISVSGGGWVHGNRVYDNTRGVVLSSGLVEDNDVFGNLETGIYVNGSGAVADGNRIYSNGRGIYLTGFNDSQRVVNNLIYGNETAGIVVQRSGNSGAPDLRIYQNTIHQVDGVGIELTGESAIHVDLRNNLLWIDGAGGEAFRVDRGGQDGYRSDYNGLYLTGGAAVGSWQDAVFTVLDEWAWELGVDMASRTGDPGFVDPDGVDGRSGFGRAVTGGATVIGPEDAGFGATAGWVDEGGYVQLPGGAGLDEVATWTFSGLEPGQLYRVGVNWPTAFSQVRARYTVVDGAALDGAVLSAREVAWTLPTDYAAAGEDWLLIGNVIPSGTTLTVVLPSPGSGAFLRAEQAILEAVVGDYGGDDDYRVGPGSFSVDAGDPVMPSQAEPGPNGGRANLGHTGNTAAARTSPARVVNVVGPVPGERFEENSTVPVEVRVAGSNSMDPVLRVNAGGDFDGDWTPDFYATGARNVGNYNTVDTSLLSEPGGQGIYRRAAYAPSPVAGTRFGWSMPVAAGDYVVRLVVWTSSNSPGNAVFDLLVDGELAVDGFDVHGAAGSSYRAVEVDVPVSWSGGTMDLVLETVAGYTLVSTVELWRVNPAGVDGGTVALRYSPDGGGTWLAVAGAAALPVGADGKVEFDWVAPAPTGGWTGLLRAELGGVAGQTPGAFRTVNDGILYFVNDGSTTGDEYSEATGANGNSGKSPDEPMATLEALVRAYDLDEGDIVFVDTGTYAVLTDVDFLASDSGVSVRGPVAGGSAVLDRDNIDGGENVINVWGADDISLDRLRVTGGERGISVVAAQRFVLTNSVVFGNRYDGVRVDTDSADAVVRRNVLYGIPGGVTDDNQDQGLELQGDRALVEDTEVYDAGLTAVGVNSGAEDVVLRRVEISASRGGIAGVGARLLIEDSEIHDNSGHGITVSGAGSVVRGNLVYGHAGSSSYRGISAGGNGVVVEGNEVFGNSTGLYLSTGLAVGNFVYNNTTGIDTAHGRIDGNHVYGNQTGIHAGTFNGVFWLLNNIVYANTDTGILVERTGNSAGSEPYLTNNTVFQEVGTAVKVQGNSREVELRNNILWVEVGYAIQVAADSQTGFVSDYNLIYVSADAAAYVGQWGAANQNELGDWQAASGADAASEQDLPDFVDRDGADGVFGYTQVDGDGGRDDNFYLRRGSPGIDSGHSVWAPRTDASGSGRADDPGTANTGTPIYEATELGVSGYAETGAARNWRSSNSQWELTFGGGFTFPYFGTDYGSVRVTSTGFLQFGGTTGIFDSTNTAEELGDYPRIAGLWDSLRTNGAGDNIFVDETAAGQVTIRWDATHAETGSDVKFSVTLSDDGRVQFHYAPAGGGVNTGLSPTVGLGAGFGFWTGLAPVDGQADLGGAASYEFALVPGVVEKGAYEFGGSSFDLEGATGLDSDPVVVHAGGSSSDTIFRLRIDFSEAVNPIDAQALANFDLRSSGGNGVFGDADDRVFELDPIYHQGDSFVVLEILDGPMPAGNYRLTLSGTTSIHDLAGNRIDGDSDGNAGGDYVRFFSLEPEFVPPTVTGIFVSGSGWSDGYLESVDPGRGLGLALPTGGVAQLEPMAQSGIDEVHVVFDEYVVIDFDAIGLGSVAGNRYFITNFTFDAETNTASWRLSQPLDNDRVELVLGDVVTDWWGNALDGEWEDGVSVGSGDGAAGGELVLHFNTLRGDVNGDGVANDRDLYAVWAETRLAEEGRGVRFDLNGDGRIDQRDVDVVVTNYLSALPAEGVYTFTGYAPTPPPVFLTAGEVFDGDGVPVDEAAGETGLEGAGFYLDLEYQRGVVGADDPFGDEDEAEGGLFE